MNRAIEIIRADMRAFFLAGFTIKQYGPDHVISALQLEGFDMRTLPPFITPRSLILSAVTRNIRKALKQ